MVRVGTTPRVVMLPMFVAYDPMPPHTPSVGYGPVLPRRPFVGESVMPIAVADVTAAATHTPRAVLLYTAAVPALLKNTRVPL